MAYGELRLTPKEFGEMTMKEINALVGGYIRRRDAAEDLLILRCALPIYRSMLGAKAPTFDELTAYRKLRDHLKTHDSQYESNVKYWSKKLTELQNEERKYRHAKK